MLSGLEAGTYSVTKCGVGVIHEETKMGSLVDDRTFNAVSTLLFGHKVGAYCNPDMGGDRDNVFVTSTILILLML